MSADRRICIHGHFYQPPRENPWLEEVEREESAAPHHDWNERIFHECYGANGESPLLGPGGQPEEIVDNYRWISFNFGPTLLSWMERHQPKAYARLLEADRLSAAERGHGNAMAQAYNHVIMPLASRRDQATQIRWGKDDFEARFKREPEGLWLPETAVDEQTLETLIAFGIRFTVLAPHQARAVRPLGASEEEWTEVDADTLDATRPYRWFSRENPGRFLDLFFYNRWLSQAVAFEGLLDDGERFARRLLDSHGPGGGLTHIATDGESYGHHHRFGNMALSYAVARIRREPGARLTNYGESLAECPPEWEVRIRPGTSWSCFHGIGRWSYDCGCRTGGKPEWNQRWRRPLRQSLDWLAAAIDETYERRARGLLRDPWSARNAYGRRFLPLNAASAHRFLSEEGCAPLGPERAREALRLCEMQRHRMLMFTSCGWFFSEISGTESVQVLKYAARALELAEGFGARLSEEFLERLEHCPSNEGRYGNAANIFRRLVEPLKADMRRAAAHFAIVDHLELGPQPLYAFEAKRRGLRRLRAASGAHARALSLITLELRHFLTFDSETFTAAVHHRGGLDVECWTMPESLGAPSSSLERLAEAFSRQPEHEFRSVAESTLPNYSTIDALFSDQRRQAHQRLGASAAAAR